MQAATIWEQRERRQMQAKHLWYNVDIRWSDLKDKLEVLAPTGLTREDIWGHLFLTKQHKNPYEEGCYTGEDVEDVKQKWEAKKHYFEQHKKDGPRPPCIDLFFFFCCIAERAIKPCRSSRSKLRGEFGIPRHLQNRNQKHKNKATRQTTTQNKQRQEPASVGM